MAPRLPQRSRDARARRAKGLHRVMVRLTADLTETLHRLALQRTRTVRVSRIDVSELRRAAIAAWLPRQPQEPDSAA